MLAEHLLTDRATITSRVASDTRDDDGNPILTTTSRDLVPCWFQQTSRSENLVAQDVDDQTWDLFFPPGDPLAATDAVTLLGLTYEVVGGPWQTTNPRTGEKGLVEATIRRTQG